MNAPKIPPFSSGARFDLDLESAKPAAPRLVPMFRVVDMRAMARGEETPPIAQGPETAQITTEPRTTTP